MSIERTYYCEGPACHGHDPEDAETPLPVHAKTATPPPYIPVSFIEVRRRDPLGEDVHHFCGWDCLMKYAAKQPVPEVIE